MRIAYHRAIPAALLLALAAMPAASPLAAQPAATGTDAAPDEMRLNAVADRLLAHLRETDADSRLRSGLPVTKLDDLTPAAAKRQGEFAAAQLAELSQIAEANLTEEQRVLAGVLRHYFESRVHSEEDYWFDFAVTPYNGGWALAGARRILQAQPVDTAARREAYLALLDEYARVIDEMAVKTRAQAARGIYLPRAAIGAIKTSFTSLRDAPETMPRVAPERLAGLAPEERGGFEAAVDARIRNRITPALDAVVKLFDDQYLAKAPELAGLGQYPGGAASYQRRITYNTGLKLTPREVHDRGLAAVADIEARMANIRAKLDFKGSREEFEEQLRKDPRFFAKTPQELEQRYSATIGRIEPKVPQYFSKLPKAEYGVKRLDAASEAGMSFGYYTPPSPDQPRGYYLYNASGLDQRSLIMAPHLILHELVPGHHFQVALAIENDALHPVRKLLYNPAFNEGWAEYGAELAVEMGGYADPYEEYGHLLTQLFMATRLVVDTGMNADGWPLERARRYMREHGSESDALADTETLRYSTDLYAQALGYRLGYEQFQILKRKSEAALGPQFDIRAYHAAAIGFGTMPLNVLEEHMDRAIAAQKSASR